MNRRCCKKCWWWQHVKHTTVTPFEREVGICYYQSHPDHKHESFEDSYCPEYTTEMAGIRYFKKGVKTWAKEKGFEF